MLVAAGSGGAVVGKVMVGGHAARSAGAGGAGGVLTVPAPPATTCSTAACADGPGMGMVLQGWGWCSLLLRPSWGLRGCSSAPHWSPARQPQSLCADASFRRRWRGCLDAGSRAQSGLTSPLLITPSPCARLQGFIGNSAAACRAHCPRAGSPRPGTGLLWSTAESCAYTTVCAAAGGRSPCNTPAAVCASSSAACSRSCAAVPAKPQRPC